MSRRSVTWCAVTLVLLVSLGYVASAPVSWGVAGVRTSADAAPALTLRTPAATAGSVIPVTVATSLAGTGPVEIQVDLNHDGHFHGAAELAYAQGQFGAEGTATVRLHGLVPGT